MPFQVVNDSTTGASAGPQMNAMSISTGMPSMTAMTSRSRLVRVRDGAGGGAGRRRGDVARVRWLRSSAREDGLRLFLGTLLDGAMLPAVGLSMNFWISAIIASAIAGSLSRSMNCGTALQPAIAATDLFWIAL